MRDPLLIVEDDATIRITVADFLRKRGFDVDAAGDGGEALALARARKHSLVLLDLRLPDRNGLDVMADLRTLDERALVVIMTAYPDVRTAVAALKAGAYDYINKPFDLDDLLELVHRALEAQRLRHEVAWRRAQEDTFRPHALIGDSPAFANLLAITARIAAADRVPVLIQGETGTGKEQIARQVHTRSPRRDGPWVTVNCSALAEGLLESEMFGHEKGAFTDAKSAKRGLFELADGGTLFLDEIGDLALSLQPKLLRALETQTFRRVGSQNETRVDVRIVAATHRDLPGMVANGSFRDDLYYRLNVGRIEVPPLRERSDDIVPLAQHFLKAIAAQIGVATPTLAPGVDAMLKAYPWPGNVRELRNVIERATLLCAGAIGSEHLPRELARHTPSPTAEAGNGAAAAGLVDVERAHILAIMAQCAGNRTHAAELLGISRPTLRSKLRQYGID